MQLFLQDTPPLPATDRSHIYGFDPTYGYHLERLLAVDRPAEPLDFAAFWQGLHHEADALPLNLVRRPCPRFTTKQRQVWEVYFDTLRGCRTGAWLSLPAEGPVRRGMVIGHGYGGREAPDDLILWPETAVLFPCARGFNLSHHPQISDITARHVVHGIESRENYVHGGCVADYWAACRVLIELVPEIGPQLEYLGGSFGGGIGLLMAAWEPRITRACFTVPSFGHYPLRLTFPCHGSGEAVRQYAQRNPGVIEVLRYFDAATAARYCQIPALFCNALLDPFVAPPSQFAAYNAYAGPRSLHLLRAGHHEWNGMVDEENRMRQVIQHWFKESPPSIKNA